MVILSDPYKCRLLFISAFPRLWHFKVECLYSFMKKHFLDNDAVMLQNTGSNIFLFSGKTDSYSDFCKSLSNTEHKLSFEN